MLNKSMQYLHQALWDDKKEFTLTIQRNMEKENFNWNYGKT